MSAWRVRSERQAVLASAPGWEPGRMRRVASEKDRNGRIREGLEVVGAGAAEA